MAALQKIKKRDTRSRALGMEKTCLEEVTLPAHYGRKVCRFRIKPTVLFRETLRFLL